MVLLYLSFSTNKSVFVLSWKTAVKNKKSTICVLEEMITRSVFFQAVRQFHMFFPCRILAAIEERRPCATWDRSYSFVQIRKASSLPNNNKSNSEFVKYLAQRIRATGPISVAEYMKECLTNPLYGYYSKSHPIGREGDFITSPEVCQIFGELLGVWCVNEWSLSGLKTPFQIIELGPGLGTLAWDVLRIISSFSQLKGLVSVHLVERSMKLAEIQARKLEISDPGKYVSDELVYKHGVSKFGLPVSWYRNIQDIPKTPAYILANEFFDALPVHKLQKTDKGFREVLVDIGADGSVLRFVIAPQKTPVTHVLPPETSARSHLEYSLEAGAVLNDIADRVTNYGGGALIIDYGHNGTKNDTFRAFRNHKVVDPLEDPGLSDLTADVDFSLLKMLLKSKAASIGPIPQYEFLTNLAFEQRFDALMKGCSDLEQQNRLTAACDLLINPKKMGGQFFVFSVVGEKRLRSGQVTGFP